MWIPDSAVKTLVDNISNIIKSKPHLIADDARINLEVLKTELEKLRLLMPNFFNFDMKKGPFLRKMVSEIREVLEESEDVVDYVYSCCSRPRSMLDRMLLTDTKSRRFQIFISKGRIKEAGNKVKHVNEEIIKKGYQVLRNIADHREIVSLDPSLITSTAPEVGEERAIGFNRASREADRIPTIRSECLKLVKLILINLMLAMVLALAVLPYMAVLKLLGWVWWFKENDGTLRSYHGSYTYLAYVCMPNHLKPCFLYLAVFRKDSEIPVWKLMRLWISEGFIVHDESGSLCLEDIAEGYLEELVSRNIVMVSKRRSNGRIGMCKLNGMFYEFCKKEAAGQNLIWKPEHMNDEVLVLDSVLVKCRRIGINANILAFLSRSFKENTGTRSLLMFSREKIEVEHEPIPESFNLLKVLDTESLFFTSLPDQLWSLVLLKYLAISGRIESLPSTLSDLSSLQTLIVDTTFITLEIKADLWKMPHFRHLHTNASATFPCQSQMNEENDNEVRTLCYISPECCKKEVFHRTTKLRKLGIRGTLAELFKVNRNSSLNEYLHGLEHLENLKLMNYNNSPSMPSNMSFPKQLKRLTLSNTRLGWKQIRTLGEMENLEILKLKDHAFVGERWKTEKGGFLRLRHLHIGHTDLKVWEASADHFPILRSLEINGCDRLERVPHRLADILSLQSVRLHSSTSPGIAYSLKRIRLVKFLQAKQNGKQKIFAISVFPSQV